MIISSIILTAIIAAYSPHDTDVAYKGMIQVPCIECHLRLPFAKRTPLLRDTVSNACSMCHLRYHGTDAMRSHPMNVVPSMQIPPDMIQDSQKKIVCFTCHAFHGEYQDEDGNKQYYLRRSPGKVFCYSCHLTLPGLATQR